MKKLFILVLILASINCHSQTTEKSDELAIQETINLFFESLEKQDTILFKNAMNMDAQFWVLNNIADPPSYGMSPVRDNLRSFDPAKNYKEIPLDFDIKVHNGIAVAWVPYKFLVDGKFSHCGIDIFTLIKGDQTWKIINATYTVENDECDELKNQGDDLH